MRLIFALLLLVNFGSAASAQVVPLRVTMQQCDLKDCREFTARGSAVHLGRTVNDHHLFLTAAHNLALPSGNAILVESGEIHVQIEEQWLPATLIRSTKRDGVDLAVLDVEASLLDLRCLPVITKPLREGDVVYLAGFPKAGDIRVLAGRVVRTQFVNHPLAINQKPIQGESGGAVVIDGQLAGIISGYPATGQPVCLFTDASAIEDFLRSSLTGDPLCYPAK